MRDRYRLYVNESGDHVFHDERALQDAGHRYLGLISCVFGGEAYIAFHDALEQFKRTHLPHSPDDPVILHRKDIINRSVSFWRLRDDGVREAFDRDLVGLIQGADFTVIGVVVDKLMLQQRSVSVLHPYHMALGFLLERYCGLLNHLNRSGDVMAESRGRKEDGDLGNAYGAIYQGGTLVRKADFFQRALASRELKLKKKSANISGLQLADLLGHPVCQAVLVAAGRVKVAEDRFGNLLERAIRDKYNHDAYTGQVEGYGWVLFPR